MSKDQKADPKTQKAPDQTRLNSELAARYANQMMPVRKRKPQPGQGSLTEDLEELAPAEPEHEDPEHEGADAEGMELEAEAEPKKSLFELPRREPSRPSLLGGGVEVDSASGAPVQPPSSLGLPPPSGPGRSRR